MQPPRPIQDRVGVGDGNETASPTAAGQANATISGPRSRSTPVRRRGRGRVDSPHSQSRIALLGTASSSHSSCPAWETPLRSSGSLPSARDAASERRRGPTGPSSPPRRSSRTRPSLLPNRPTHRTQRARIRSPRPRSQDLGIGESASVIRDLSHKIPRGRTCCLPPLPVRIRRTACTALAQEREKAGYGLRGKGHCSRGGIPDPRIRLSSTSRRSPKSQTRGNASARTPETRRLTLFPTRLHERGPDRRKATCFSKHVSFRKLSKWSDEGGEECSHAR